MTRGWFAIAFVAPVLGCTRPAQHGSREASTPPAAPPRPDLVAFVDATTQLDAPLREDSADADGPPDVANAVARGPMPLTRVPNVFEGGAQRPVVDRPLASPLTEGARVEIRFDVETGSHRTRVASYQTLTGILRSPQLALERRMGGSAAPTSCESRVQDDGHAMFFRCAGDVEDAHGRVWIDGDHVMLVMASSREAARPSSAPPSGTIERFALPPGASVRFHAGHGALGM